MIEQLITSFIASAAFGILFNSPKGSLLQCGFVGMVGWLIYVSLIDIQLDAAVATAIASAFVAVISQFFAKFYRTPVIVFSVSGVIPLVPGGLAYDAMRNVVENDYITAIRLAAEAFMISGSIAIGLIVSEVVYQMIRKAKHH